MTRPTLPNIEGRIPPWPGEGSIAVTLDGVLECTWRVPEDARWQLDGVEQLPIYTHFGNRILVRLLSDNQNEPLCAALIEATPAAISAGARNEIRLVFLTKGKPERLNVPRNDPSVSLAEQFASHRPIIDDPAAARVHTLLKSGLRCGSHPAVNLEISWARLYGSLLYTTTVAGFDGVLPTPSLPISRALELFLGGSTDESIKEVARLWDADPTKLSQSIDSLDKRSDSGSLSRAVLALLNLVLLSSEMTARGQVQACVSGYNWRITQRPLSPGASIRDIDSSRDESESFWLRLPPLISCWHWNDFLDPADIPASRSEIAEMLGGVPTSDESEMDRLANAALDEIGALSRWTVPPLARVRLDCGSLAAVDVLQVSASLVAIFRNPDNHFFVAMLDKSSREIVLLLPQPIEFPSRRLAIPGYDDDPSSNQLIHSALRLLLATLWRDFTVPDERPFASSRETVPSGLGGRSAQLTRLTYLPKVRYSGPLCTRDTLAQLETQDDGFRLQSQVAGHLRRAKNPASAQLRLAAIWGINVPPDHTFVRPHVRMSAHRERVYRSRSYLKMMLEPSNAAQSREPDIWLEFEQAARRTLENRNVEVSRTAVTSSGHLILYGLDEQRRTTVAIAPFDDLAPAGVVRDLDRDAQRISARTMYLIVRSHLDRVAQAEASRRGIRVVRIAQPGARQV